MKTNYPDELFEDDAVDALQDFDFSKARRAIEVPHLNKLREQESSVVRIVSGQSTELSEREDHEQNRST